MPGEDNIDVTLACVDPALVSSWDKLVKQGKECSLLLKHSKGKVIATLQCTTPSTPSTLSSSASLPSSAKRKKKKGGKKRKLDKLLAYHQRLVVEKGLPPSRLMEKHAAISSAPSDQSAGANKKFKCDQCDFTSDSQRGLKVHVGRSHKNPEVLRDGEPDQSLDLSCASSKREEISFNAEEASKWQEQEVEEQREIEVSPFISALSKTLSLWPEEEEEHRCSSFWCRNLKCLLEVEKRSRERDAVGDCDKCEENKNDCECDQDSE